MVGIPIYLNIILLVLFVFAGFMESRRLFAKDPNLDMKTALKRAPYLYVLIPVSIILLIFANLNRPHLIWNLPLWFQYHYTALNWGAILVIFSFTFSLASSIAFKTSHRERWKLVIAGVLLIGVVQVMQWSYTRPIAPLLKDVFGSSGLVFQSYNSSCAAASGASIARTLGLKKSEREMAELFATTMGGTSGAQVIYGMKKIGFACNKVEIVDCDPEKLEAPAMIFIDNQFTGPESHAAVYLGFDTGKAEIWDPLEGKRLLRKDELEKIWHGRGIEIGMDKGS